MNGMSLQKWIQALMGAVAAGGANYVTAYGVLGVAGYRDAIILGAVAAATYMGAFLQNPNSPPSVPPAPELPKKP